MSNTTSFDFFLGQLNNNHDTFLQELSVITGVTYDLQDLTFNDDGSAQSPAVQQAVSSNADAKALNSRFMERNTQIYQAASAQGISLDG